MARERVEVRPGILPATMMVAPNSPSARAKANSMPPAIPRLARGSVIVKNTRHGPAPNVCATCSSRWFTSSKATRAERTSNGNDITPSAIKTPRQVNTMSRLRVSCKKPPMTPRRPRNLSRINPVATGGMTRGRVTSVSTIDFPGHSRRARPQAATNPKGKIKRMLRAETQAVNHTICQSSLDMESGGLGLLRQKW